MDHRAAPDALQYLVHRRLGLSGHLVDGPDDGADAQAQLVDGLVRWVQPPDSRVPQSGQFSMECATRCVGVMRWRAKPWGRGFLGPFSLGVCWRPDLGLMPGIPLGPPGLAFPSSGFNPPLQLGDGRLLVLDEGLLLQNGSLLPGADGDEGVAADGVQVNIGIHAIYMT